MERKVSVCVPVFRSESYLGDCLKSLGEQTFNDFEVIIVNDGSDGTDSEGNCCKKIVKIAKKKWKFPINYIEHKKNKGLLEARRTAVYAARGDYIFNLDSDDKLPSNGLELLYRAALESGADIVHGEGDLFFVEDGEYNSSISEDRLKKAREERLKKITNVYPGIIENNDILNSYLVENTHCGFLWGKLFKKELYLEAFDKIPSMFCTLAEDVIQYFWIAYFAKKYFGIKDCVYYYCDSTGITGNSVIDNLDKWEQICSVSSVFTGIYTSLEESNIKLEKSQRENISLLCCKYAANNLMELKYRVVPELHNDAYKILKDYWGEDFISKIEMKLKEEKGEKY